MSLYSHLIPMNLIGVAAPAVHARKHTGLLGLLRRARFTFPTLKLS